MAPKPIGIVASKLRKRFHRENPGLNLGDLVETPEGELVEYRNISASADPPAITINANRTNRLGRAVEVRGIQFEGKDVRLFYNVGDRPKIQFRQTPHVDLTSLMQQPPPKAYESGAPPLESYQWP